MAIEITSAMEKWRFTCPEGHHDWRVWDGVFSCETCKSHRDGGRDINSVHEELIDTVTGERVTRSEIEFDMTKPAEAL